MFLLESDKNLMAKKEIAGGAIPYSKTKFWTGKHKLPADFGRVIRSDSKVTSLWKNITPLARNEWICWVTSAVKTETRERRILVGLDKI